MTLLINQNSQRYIDGLVNSRLPHAVGIYGDIGVGLSTIANEIAKQLGYETIFVYPKKQGKANRNEGSITIDDIRDLYDLTKSTRPKGIIFTLLDADKMTKEASNAFLKLLEEPNKNIHFILLSHNLDQILPTVRSRLQTIAIKNVSNEQSEMLIDESGVMDPQKRQQLLFLASGRPALLTRLIQDESMFDEMAADLRLAKRFVESSPYVGLMIANQVSNNREGASKLLSMSARLLNQMMIDRQRVTPKMINFLSRIEKSQRLLSRNGNVRLVLAGAAIGETDEI